MRKFNLMDRALFALSVPTCVACHKRLSYGQKAFCPECSAVFDDFRTRNCARCAKVLSMCDCSNDFLAAHYVKRVVKCYHYLDRDEVKGGNALIYSLKRDNRSDVLEVCSDLLIDALNNANIDFKNCVFVNVPRRKAAIIEYGIDHSELLARAIAKRLRSRYIPLLLSRAKRAQKSLETTERFKNAEFYLNRKPNLSGKTVIIVDDIITTGASVGKAAALVRSLGCKDIIASTLAIAYKDM